MRFPQRSALALAVLALSASLLARAGASPPRASPTAPKSPGFEDFERRARRGERLNIVFFGASLTWGANSSNPIETSYRADTARKFEAAYPRAHFRFFDAAIGGTGSQLGVFRLQRDVLSRHPDLVFLDFSANDDIYSQDPQTLASYESIVRRLVQARVPVVQALFPFRWNADKGPSELPRMKRRTSHLAIASAYNTGVGDAVDLAIRRVASGAATLDALWPIDGVHPGDRGYALFSDAAFGGFEEAVRDKKVCRAPARMLSASTYMTQSRLRISQLGPLPAGWKVGIPNRVSAYFDFLMSRWLDDVVIASNRSVEGGAAGKTPTAAQQAQPLRVKFQGSMVMLLGESTPSSGRYRATLDGKLIERSQGGKMLTEYDPAAFGKAIGGNGHHVQVLASGLDPQAEHTLEIEPVFASDALGELRLESICVAGGAAQVRRAMEREETEP
jgi:lysophospholipase L1-like esterase